MAPSPERSADDAAERVVVNIDGLEELSAIREALDGIREAIDWWINNHRGEPWMPVQPITSMPVDSAAPDRAERLNTFTATNPPEHAPPKQRTPRPAQPPDPVATDGIDRETQFCCEAPDLQWRGDPQFPGVACQHCGYTVADCGSVVMQSSPEADPGSEPKEEQRALFDAE